jgi:hypothetical protein
MTSARDICVGAENRCGGEKIGSRQFGGRMCKLFSSLSRDGYFSCKSTYKVKAFCICADGLLTINVLLFKKMRDIIFFWWDNHFMSHFEGHFEGAETFLTP